MIKKFLKIFLILLLAIAVFGAYLFFTQKGDSGQNPEDKNLFSFFPFGQLSEEEFVPNNEGLGDGENNTPDEGDQLVLEPRLRRLSNTDVAGATFLYKERPKPNEDRISFTFVDFSEFPLMRLGFEGEKVARLENTLTLLATNVEGVSEKMIFDEETENLLKDFQSSNGLRADGRAGASVWSAINKAQEDLAEEKMDSVLSVRYIQKEDGSIIDMFLDSLKTSISSDTVIPRIQEAFFNSDASQLIIRYLKSDNETIETVGGTIEDGSLSGKLFPQNIPFVSVSPEKDQVFYLEQEGDFTNGIISTFSNLERKPIFEHAFSEWIPNWGTDSVISLTTKASFGTPGGVYSLGVTQSNFIKEFGGKNGLTTLMSPNGAKILYSENLNGNIKLSVFNMQDNSHTDLGIRTLPEKCTWDTDSITVWCAVPKNINSSRLPDSWYQGTESFVDSLWLLNTDENAHQLIIDPTTEGLYSLDITNIQLSPKKDYLIFIDRKSSILYGLTL